MIFQDFPTDPSTDYIGSTLFHEQYKSDILNHMEKSVNINNLIDKLSEEQHQKSGKSPSVYHKEFKKQASKIVNDMIADMSSLRVLRGFAFTIKTLLTRLYHHGIHVSDEEIIRLRNVAKEASARGVSLIFVPCHKSHVDYLVVSYVLYRMGIGLPHIAAGDNLNMPGVGWVLRHNGAFFIRREWGGDRLYVTIMQEYVEYLLNKGYNIEAFIEGTRSRTGKLLQPKFGFLKLILESILKGKTSDAILIPVSIGYDKVIETPSYVNELLGTPKQKESIGQLLNSINLLQLRWGRIDVRFGEAFSMSDFAQKLIASGKSGIQRMNLTDQSTYILQSLGYRILGDINRISVIMPTALVGTVLLTLRGRGVGRNELIRRVGKLKSWIIARGGQVAESGASDASVIVDRTVQVLSDIIGRRYDILERVYYPLKRFELSYYRNQVIHLFVQESILSVAMYATLKVGGPIRAQRIPIKTVLFKDVQFVSQLLKFEFVYDAGGLEQNLDATLNQLVSANVAVIGKEEEENPSNGGKPGDLWVTLSAEERRTGRETFDFYCFMLWPFIETYWLCAMSLYTILPKTELKGNSLYWIDQRVFMKRSQIFGKTLYYEGDISYFESVNRETISNAIGRLKQLGCIKLHKGVEPPPESVYETSPHSTNANTTWIAVAKDWIPAERLPDSNLRENVNERNNRKEWEGSATTFAIDPVRVSRPKNLRNNINYYQNETDDIEKITDLSKKSPTVEIKSDAQEDDKAYIYWNELRPKGRLWEFCEQIGRFRREGKNRRDTSTVANRVLRLAQFASEPSLDGKKKQKQALKVVETKAKL